MSIKKIIAGITATAVSAVFMTVSAFAQEISVNKDFKTTWTDSTTIPGTAFSEVNENTVLTIKYTTDASIADTEGQDYWVIKPMINDNGWPFIAGISQLRLSESGDSYELDTDKTEASFTIPAGSLDHLKTAGMALMGHGVILETITISNDISIDDNSLVIQTSENPSSANEAASGEAQTSAEPDVIAAPPKTGNTDISSVMLCIIALSASAIVISKKK